MTPYYDTDGITLVHGDCLDVMRDLPDNSVDAIVTDPPYGLGFMGKRWDDLPPGLPWAQECLRVLKPGRHLLAFGGARTWHRLAVAVEDAGFDMRDSIAWLYGSGFPKSKQHLKPAFEPIVVARKPGAGWLNIDGCRIPGTVPGGGNGEGRSGGIMGKTVVGVRPVSEGHSNGRWPANVALDASQAAELDRQSGTTVSRIGAPRGAASGDGWGMTATGTEYDDEGGASRFFYVAKAPRDERP